MGIAFVLALIAVLLVNWSAFQSASDEAEAQRQLSYEYRTQVHLSGLMVELHDLDAYHAAYLATGREDFRRRFATARNAVVKEVQFLRRHAADNQLTRIRLDRLDLLVAGYLARLDRGANLRQAGQREAALRQLLRVEDDIRPRRIEKILRTLRSDGYRLLARRELEVDQDLVREQALVVLRGAGMVALLGILFLLVRQERRRRLAEERSLRDRNARLEDLAREDALTGLRNRRALEEDLVREWSRALRYQQPLSLLLLDVDHFKGFNDTYGHLVGDDVLRLMAEILRKTTRGSDVLARYGGEEFIVLLPCTGPADAMLVGERLRKALERHAWSHRPVTISVGIATMNLTMHAPSDLVRAADAALYQAKASGRDRVLHAGALETPLPAAGG